MTTTAVCSPHPNPLPKGEGITLVPPLVKPILPRYTAHIHQPTEYIRRPIMLYCEIFNVSHTFGDRTSSSVIGIVLR